ncbi:V-type ATP synthase subunit alpha [Thermoclostridium stercorarium subsp. stercorarium DSM 8532]|uniref:V-type ATP synthase alpha chain n=2 Tax=Thermoclostridium stercorarium TaxID=1510 RepID=L7VV02_THES1|nr:V-type ATP synthase subunit A [Thermoclostridium stercorarium]AGC69413.1 V-type ATP synthase subunit alpha [Thermoclostridium stercorarium subsp. stercorarium DSM 8532]AGI40371.1 H+-ATPase subunit A [Thermoclostridium stercorarium subsp. stercorarium DSM 8532]ANW99662.1 ATP synthase subunit A [Thermoclostridium stercorarium subsp. thermolacticum DSM 2910]
MVTVQGTIYGINGPVIRVMGNNGFKMHETVLVGFEKLIGEVIGINENETIVQVYENTTGLKTGEPVISTGRPLSVMLGPGIIGNIFDGIQRPLVEAEKASGPFIQRGMSVSQLDLTRKWKAEFLVKKGDFAEAGTKVAKVQETDAVVHFVMVPPDIRGEVVYVAPDGEYTITDTIMKIKTEDGTEKELTMLQEWPVRVPRPYKKRKELNEPLITGQRVIDTLFPVAKGGAAAIPGGFGTGKTMTQHQLAKWSDADIIVYIGCGERGNEITEVLEDFPKLVDPRTGKPLMNRTVLIANTSNMPVAAREASIYTGITLAEYYRDMGYDVAVMADSTSRWAEALREISGRLEEMPAEEGFPAYLPSRLSQFYERAGRVENMNGTVGSITIIGAVSPQGNDFSEPVTQNTKRFIRCFWALDKQLAYARHYPAINWVNSYSEYYEDMKKWYRENADSTFDIKRAELLRLLQEENKLLEIVKLIGSDILPDEQKLILEVSKVIRQGFLQQNAYHEVDTYVPVKKQYYMMDTILILYNECKKLVERNIPVSVIRKTGIFDEVIRMKYAIGNDDSEGFEKLVGKIYEVLNKISDDYGTQERKSLL